jgi:hypothetical protein
MIPNFNAPDAHFDNLHVYLFSDVQTEKVGNPKYYDCKDRFGGIFLHSYAQPGLKQGI